MAVALLGACSGGGGQRALVRQPGTSTSTTLAPATTTTTVAATRATMPAPAGCPALPARAVPAPDRPRYLLDFTVDFPQGVVAGVLEVHFRPDLTTDRLVFRLWPNGAVMAAGGARLDVSAITVDGRPV